MPSSDYIIGPEDVLGIDVFNVPELSRTVRVANDGTISLTLLGRVEAAGLTTDGLEAKLESKLGETYLENPQVSVYLREFHAQPVSIVGAVENPGLYQLTGPRRLIEMLSTAGGLAKRSSGYAGRTATITRKGGFKDLQQVEGMEVVAPDQLEINLRKLLFSKETALNIQIKPMDIISVSKADIVYVLGRGVEQPGGYVLEDQDKVTVFQALAMARGMSENAAGKDARIIHTKEDGTKIEIPVNLKKIEKGESPDPLLAANDILFVPDSVQWAAIKKGLSAAVQTISGVVIFGTTR